MHRVGRFTGKEAAADILLRHDLRRNWARAIRDQCTAAGVPFFFKQWGEWAPGTHVDPDQDKLRTAHLEDWCRAQWHYGTETRAAAEGGHIDDEPDVYRVGKRTAGRSLDGREWNEMPAIAQRSEAA